MKRIIYHFIIVALFLSNIMSGNAQQYFKVNNVSGSCVIANISPEKAKENALFNAKIEALRQAGIPENLLAEITQMGEIFIETSNIEIGGGITEYEIVSDEIRIAQEGKSRILISEVVINAKVVKYNKESDPSFQIKVQALKSVYKEQETLYFDVTAYQNGYLRIFLFEEDGTGTQIYPDKAIEPDMLFMKNNTIKFPINDHYYYVVEKTDKTKNKEINRILFLFLKDNINFTEDYINLQSILNWKAGISPDKRTQVFREFTIEQ